MEERSGEVEEAAQVDATMAEIDTVVLTTFHTSGASAMSLF